MKKGTVLFWKYDGYVGDQHYMRTEALINRIPGARPRKVKHVCYLSQKGFGQGYFNSSGKYKIFVKSTLVRDLTEAEVAAVNEALGYSHTRYDSRVEFDEDVKRITAHAKQMNKQNPY